MYLYNMVIVFTVEVFLAIIHNLGLCLEVFDSPSLKSHLGSTCLAFWIGEECLQLQVLPWESLSIYEESPVYLDRAEDNVVFTVSSAFSGALIPKYSSLGFSQSCTFLGFALLRLSHIAFLCTYFLTAVSVAGIPELFASGFLVPNPGHSCKWVSAVS